MTPLEVLDVVFPPAELDPILTRYRCSAPAGTHGTDPWPGVQGRCFHPDPAWRAAP